MQESGCLVYGFFSLVKAFTVHSHVFNETQKELQAQRATRDSNLAFEISHHKNIAYIDNPLRCDPEPFYHRLKSLDPGLR